MPPRAKNSTDRLKGRTVKGKQEAGLNAQAKYVRGAVDKAVKTAKAIRKHGLGKGQVANKQPGTSLSSIKRGANSTDRLKGSSRVVPMGRMVGPQGPADRRRHSGFQP